MKRYIKTLVTSIGVLSVFLLHSGSVDAAFFRFNPTSVSSVSGNTFQVSVTVDSGSDEILSSDAYVLFDSTVLQADSVADGTYFPYVVHNITPGKVSIRGLVTDAATSRTGSGILATITFRSIAPGNATLSFFCDMNASDTSKIVKNDINATNIIVCTQNNTAKVAVVAPTPAPSGSVTPPNPTAPPAGVTGGTSGTGSGNTGSGAQQGGPGTGGNASIGNGQNVNPSQLPVSGGLDNLSTIGVAGSILILVGGAAALIL